MSLLLTQLKNLTLYPPPAALVLTGSAPQLRKGISPANASLALTGSAPQLRKGIRPALAALILAGSVPTLQIGGGPVGNFDVMTSKRYWRLEL